jgi:hypothetical protein
MTDRRFAAQSNRLAPAVQQPNAGVIDVARCARPIPSEATDAFGSIRRHWLAAERGAIDASRLRANHDRTKLRDAFEERARRCLGDVS